MSDAQDDMAATAERRIESPYDLRLHESMDIDGWIVTAVPGGWIYKSFSVAVFVPLYQEPEQEIQTDQDDQAFKDAIIHYINTSLSGTPNQTEGNRLIRTLLKNAHS